MVPLPGKTRGRRGRRIARRLPLMLHWREPMGAWREIPVETRMLSRHGCLVSCRARIKYSDEVMVWWMEKMRYTKARVVFRRRSRGATRWSAFRCTVTKTVSMWRPLLA